MEKLFIFDKKTKRLYLLISLIWIFYIISFIIEYFELIIELDDLLKYKEFINSIARIMVILPFLIHKIFIKKKNYNIKLKKKDSNRNIKSYIILILIIINNFFSIFFKLLFIGSFDYINEAILLFFLSILMKFYSDFNFYKHKILALFLFSIFAIIIDRIILHNIFNFETILFNIYIQFLLSIKYSYQQYLISNKYISIYKVCSFFGLIDFIFLIVINILINQFNNKFTFKVDYIDNYYFKTIIFKNYKIIPKLIPLIIIYIIIFIIEYLIVYYFSLIHLIIIDVFTYIFTTSYQEFRYKLGIVSYIILGIIVIFILISIFIYLELIELKFGGLNKNTRRNILKREKKEKMEIDPNIYKEDGEDEEDDSENYTIEISKGYLLDLKNMNNSIL